MYEASVDGGGGKTCADPMVKQSIAALPRLTLRARLGLLSVIVFVPIALFAHLFVSHAAHDIEVVRRELAGAAELETAWPPSDASAEATAAAADRIAGIADRSGITLDPALDTYYLGHAVTIRLPQLMAVSARLDEALGATDADAADRIGAARADVRAATAYLQDALEKAGAAQDDEADRAGILRTSRALDSVVATHKSRARAGGADSGRAETIGDIKAATHQAWVVTRAQLETALSRRLKSLRRQLALNLAAMGLCVLAAIGMMVLIHGSVVRSIGRLGEVVRRLMIGDTTTDIPYLDDRHEWGQLAQALLAYRTALVDRTRLQDDALAAMRAKTEFLDNINHEIRTPLNGVIGVADALARTRLGKEQQRMVGLIRSSGRSVERLLADVLDFSRLAAGGMPLETAPFDPETVLRDAVDLFAPAAAGKGLTLEFDLTGALPPSVEGDAAKIARIVSNLVCNGTKFTDKGGVAVTARVDADPAREGVAWLEIEVRDTGIGFDDALLSVLLDRFTQADPSTSRRFGGAGLGLSISKALLDLMGGSLSATSTPGEGSRFMARIPVRPIEAPAAEADHGEIQNLDRQVRVLLVEDHPLNRQVVQLLLEPLGVHLTMAENGAEGVERFEKERFDLILMDIQMPVLDGLAATASIRDLERVRRAPRTPIVMLTANSTPENRIAATKAGADAHLAKPVNYRELFDVVAAVA